MTEERYTYALREFQKLCATVPEKPIAITWETGTRALNFLQDFLASGAMTSIMSALLRARYTEQVAIDEIARRFWIADYPNGGSLYKSYEETPFHDQELYRKQARDILIGQIR